MRLMGVVVFPAHPPFLNKVGGILLIGRLALVSVKFFCGSGQRILPLLNNNPYNKEKVE
jgi:hypothetical protein